MFFWRTYKPCICDCVTASGRYAWQYCNPFKQEQWIAFKPCLQKGRVHPESGSRPVNINN